MNLDTVRNGNSEICSHSIIIGDSLTEIGPVLGHIKRASMTDEPGIPDKEDYSAAQRGVGSSNSDVRVGRRWSYSCSLQGDRPQDSPLSGMAGAQTGSMFVLCRRPALRRVS